jgi:MFS family permease
VTVIETVERTTFREVLTQPVFRVIFVVRSLAIGADALRILALSVLIFQSTGSAALAAATFGIGFIPQMIGGVLLGALPDLFRPRLLIVAGYTAECAGALALAALEMPVWLSLVIVGVLGGIVPVFHGTAGRLTAEVLEGDAFVVGRSMLHMASAVAQLGGLAAGGIAVAVLGPRPALLIVATCHLIATVVSRLGLPNLPATPAGDQSAVRRSLRGSRELLGNPAIRILLLTQWLPPAFICGAESLLVPYAELRDFPRGSAGLMLACVPVGMLVGDLIVVRLLRPETRERLVIPLIVVLGLPLLAFPFEIGPVLGGALLFVVGSGFAFSAGLQRRFLDRIPDNARGQSFALMSTGLMTLQGIGPIGLGALAEVIAVGPAIGAAGAGTLLVAMWLWTRRDRY